MSKVAAKGAIVKVTVASVLTAVPYMGDLTLSLGETERIDVTTHDSAGNAREFLQTWQGEGQLSFGIKYDPANAVHEALRAAHGGAAIASSVVLPDAGAATFTFNANVTGFEITAGVDGALEASITMKTTGAVTFAA